MHAIIAEALAGLGAGLETVAVEAKTGDILCFQHHTPGDLRIGPAKVVGSAQRRQRGALLQHGAVLLAASLPIAAGAAGRGRAALGDASRPRAPWRTPSPSVSSAAPTGG